MYKEGMHTDAVKENLNGLGKNLLLNCKCSF